MRLGFVIKKNKKKRLDAHFPWMTTADQPLRLYYSLIGSLVQLNIADGYRIASVDMQSALAKGIFYDEVFRLEGSDAFLIEE